MATSTADDEWRARREPLHIDKDDAENDDGSDALSASSNESSTSLNLDASAAGAEDDAPPSLPLHETNIPSLVGAFSGALTTGGTTYAFGLYASALKHTLHLSQSELDTISSAFFCAGLLSWLPGMCVDRFGPRFSMSAGGILGAASLLSYWAVATSLLPVPRGLIVLALSLLGVLSFVSSALVTGSVFKVIVGSCGPGTKGTAVGSAKGYVGLGAGAYACIFEALRGSSSGGGDEGDPSDLNFLPMAAFFAVTAATIPALCLLPPKNPPRGTPARKDVATPMYFHIIYAGLFLLGLLVVGASVLELYEDSSNPADSGEKGDSAANSGDETSRGGHNVGMALLIVTMWLGPVYSLLFLPRREYEVPKTMSKHAGRKRSERKQKNRSNRDASNSAENGDYSSLPIGSEHGGEDNIEMSEEKGSINGDDALDVENGTRGTKEDDLDMETAVMLLDDHPDTPVLPPTARGENLTLYQMLQTLPAWLLLWTCTILAGGGTVITNNIGQMAEALRLEPSTAPASLALFSAAQAASRVATGAISESALTWKWFVPRPAFLVLASFCGCAAHFLLAVASSEFMFVIGVALTGAAFGMIWPLMVLIVGECFGNAHVGANYMFYDGVTSALGTLLLSKFVAQEVYESHIVAGSGDSGDDSGAKDDALTCFGEGCFELSHFIVSALSLSCVFTSLAMLYKTRHVYQRD